MLFLLQTILISACQPAQLEPVLLHAKHSLPISGENPVVLSFETTAETPILVQILGFEAELESRIFDAQGNRLNEARLSYIRTGPVYQLIEADQANGMIKVSVSATHQTKAATVSILVYQLPQGGRTEKIMEQAYRHYSNAIQSTDSGSTDLWRLRVGELQQAANLFRRTGLKEQALWSEWLLAYFTYFPVSEFQAASELARKVKVQARKSGLAQLELMAMQLEGQAMIEHDGSDSPELAAAKLEKARQLFKQSAELAGREGMRFEQAWAINNRGITYYYQGLLNEALEQYQQVLPIALELQDVYLANLARGNVAMVNERLGNHAEALQALLAIGKDWEDSELTSERVLNLADIGRLYSKLFLFSDAIDALSEAMNLARGLDDRESIGRIGLSLAMAYYDMGQRQRARDMLLTAIDNMKEVNYGRGLREAYRLLADMHRHLGAHDQVKVYREKQQQYLRSDRERANFLFSQGLDALAMDDPADAGELFSASHTIALEIDNTGLQVRSLLRYCAIVPVSKREQMICDTAQLEGMLNGWLPQVAPRYALDARFSWAQFIAGQGADGRALMLLEDLVADIQTFRSRLPGVMGAWYWESRKKVFSSYMDLLLKRVQSPQQITNALVALDRFRNLEISSRRRGSSDHTLDIIETDKVRLMVARMSGSMEDSARQELGREIDQILLASRNDANHEQVYDDDPLYELASLPPDAAYLTYYFSKSGAWAWVAAQQGVQLLRLGDAKPILALIEKVRDGIRVVGNDGLIQDLDALGSMLIQPIATSLSATIYLGSAGAMAGFPFEAIRHNGRFLAEDHAVINLLSLDGISDLTGSGQRGDQWGSVILVGTPKTPGSNFYELSGAASEIEDIAQLFKQRQLQNITQADLQRTSFSRPGFSHADLIHIASHGSINLNYPELSRLSLSNMPDSDNSDYLTPLDINQNQLQARLVVLSACETTGLNDFSYDSNLGFVSQFLRAGAGTVVASLWPVSDLYTRDFMRDFYSALLNGKGIPDALVLAKRKHLNATRLKGSRALGIQDWAAFQIYAE